MGHIFLFGRKTPVHCHHTVSYKGAHLIARTAMGGQGKAPSGAFSQDLGVLRKRLGPCAALVGLFGARRVKDV